MLQDLWLSGDSQWDKTMQNATRLYG